MTNTDLLRRAPPDTAAWFDTIAALLLDGVELLAGESVHRPVEIEFYLSSPAHPDPFAHGDPVQRANGTWYFHRSGGSYRGGSFKGLDITFGGESCGGILIRTLRASDGTVTNGSSLCVDRLLACTGHASVAALDAEVAGRSIWSPDSPVRLRRCDSLSQSPVWKTARVGLTLKRAADHPLMDGYIMRRYRHLTDARAVKKGRLLHILALHRAGVSTDEIHALTGSPRSSIAKHIAAYARGRTTSDGDLSRWHGRALRGSDLSMLHGAADALCGG
jgi:hypothetical protein